MSDKYRFIENKNSCFGQGNFTAGKEYKIIGDPEHYPEMPSDAKFVDDEGDEMWEDLDCFESVDK